MTIETPQPDPATERERRGLQLPPDEVERLFDGVEPFNAGEWERGRLPSTTQELAEMEEFLNERRAEREAARAREAGVGG